MPLIFKGLSSGTNGGRKLNETSYHRFTQKTTIKMEADR